MMLLVVPREEFLAEATGLFEGTKAIREVRPVLQCFEVGFREGIVIRDMETAVRFDNTEICQQQGY